MHSEISILQAIGNHPYIMNLHDVFAEAPTTIYMVRDHCEGGELYDRIRQKMFYKEGEAKAVLYQLCEALGYVHSKGIMHRDLKPENILLVHMYSDIEVKLSNFKFAKAGLQCGSKRLELKSASVCGSDYYLPPEMIKLEKHGMP